MRFARGRFHAVAKREVSRRAGYAALSAAILMTLGKPSTGIAATDTWNGTTDSNWSTSTDWDTGVVPGSADTAVFNNAGNGNTTVSIGNVSVGNILFDTSSAASYTLGTGVGVGTITLGDGGSVTLNASVTHNEWIDSDILLGSDATTQSYTFNSNWSPKLIFAGTISGGGGGGGGTVGTKTLTVGGSGSTTISGNIIDGGAVVALTKSGAGTLTLSGANAYSGDTTIGNGPVYLTGAITTPGNVNVGGSLGPALLAVNGGTLRANHPGTSVVVGNTASAYASALAVNGGSFGSPGDVLLSTAPGSIGEFALAGGTANVNGRVTVGAGGNGILQVSGGALTLAAAGKPLTIGSVAGSAGTASIIGGTTAVNSQVVVGDAGSGTLNLTGPGGSLFAQDGLLLARQSGSSGALNMTSGVLTTPGISVGAGTTSLNLNGGTLQATQDNPDFLSGIGSAYVYRYTLIDTNGYNIGIDQSLLAPTGNGVSANTSGLKFSGNYTVPPIVQVVGGGGSGAAARAILDSYGNLTGLQIVSPGINYTSPPTFNLVGGIGNGSISGTASLFANSGQQGALGKFGAGTLTLTGANTFPFYLYVSQGTVVADATNTPSVLAPSVVLYAAGGTFQLLSRSGSAAQVLNGIRMYGAGQSVIDASNVGGGGVVLDLRGTSGTAGITYHTGSTIDFRASVGGPLGPNNTGSQILTHQQNDASGILGGYLTVNGGTDWAANDGNDNIVPFTGYVDVPAGGGVIPDGANTNVRINSAGDGSGTISLGGAGVTSINTLLHNISSPATIDTTGATLHMGQFSGVLLPAGAGPLTIGTAPNAGTLTAGPQNQYGNIIISNNTASSLVTINSTITNSGTGSVELIKVGPGPLLLTSTNSTYNGGLQLVGGVTTIMSDRSLGAADGNVNNVVTLVGGTLQLGAPIAFSSQRNFSFGGITGGVVGGTIDTQAYDATISGMMSGTGNLTKLGSGTLTIAGAYTGGFSGTVTVSQGTVQLGTPTLEGPLAQCTGILNNAALGFYVRYGAYESFTGPISGNGTVTKTGAGPLTLSSGNSSFTGPLNISAGAILATGLGANPTSSSTGSGPVTVGPGGTLGGGTVGAASGAGPAFHVGGSVTLNAGSTTRGGTIAPAGASGSTANLTTGAETWNGGGAAGQTGGVYAWQLNLSNNSAGQGYVAGALNTDKSGANWGQLSMNGLTVNAGGNAAFNIQLLTLGSAGTGNAFNPTKPYAWVVANVPAGNQFNVPAGALVLDTSSVPSSITGRFSVSTLMDSASDPGFDDIVISYSPAPEPTSLALLGIGAAGLFVRRRRRSNRP